MAEGGGKAKVMLIIPSLCKGGAERIFSLLLEHLDREKMQILCIFYKSDHVYAIPDDIKVLCLDMPGSDNILKKIFYTVRRLFNIVGIIKKEEPDAILSALPEVNFTAVLARILSNISGNKKRPKLIIYEVTTLSVHLKTLKKLFGIITEFFIRTLYPMADRVLVNAEGVKRDLIDKYNVPREIVDVLYSPMDMQMIRELSREEVTEHPWFSSDVPVIINVGTLRAAKAQHFLLKAFKLVREKAVCRLVIIGEGEREAELKQLTRDLGLSGDAEIFGFKENVFKFISKSAVFVLSSIYEGFPTVLIEAMACGVPVVSTRCPSGPEEVIEDAENGLLVPVGDEERLAEAMLAVVSDPHAGAVMVSKAEAVISRYDVSNVIKDYERLLLTN